MSELVSVGRVGKPHGLDGSFFVEQASEDAQRFAVGATLHVDGEPAEVVASKRSRGRPVIRLDHAAPTGENEYYAFQLVGLDVEEDGGLPLGRVAAVQPGVANDVIELESGALLPLVDACVLEVDLEGRRIVVASGFAPSS